MRHAPTLAALIALAGACALSACGAPEPAATSASPSAASPSAFPEPSVSPSPQEELLRLADLADAAWVADTAEATGIPGRAMAAYAGASLQLAAEQPGCLLDWATLAGVGWVESHHGTYGGGGIGTDGVVSPPLIGIALDGTKTLKVPDTDGGRLDGDKVWDRAVGPMQIIATTWAKFGADGNGDGVSDPQQIDDASLAAARYLCAAGADLSQPGAWMAAVAAYNPSVSYNNQVAHATDAYRTGTRP